MACLGFAARAPRAALAALLAACLLAGALADPSFTSVVAGTSTDSLTGSVYDDKTGKATCAKCPVDTYQALTGKTTCSACCKDGTELGKTCFLWTRGKTGAAKCDATRVRPGKLL
eukprot:scaffold14.g1258.t1